MPKGPKGQSLSSNAVGCAMMVAWFATGKIEDTRLKQPAKHKGGLAGAEKRVAATMRARRSEIARNVTEVRWAEKRVNA